MFRTYLGAEWTRSRTATRQRTGPSQDARRSLTRSCQPHSTPRPRTDKYDGQVVDLNIPGHLTMRGRGVRSSEFVGICVKLPLGVVSVRLNRKLAEKYITIVPKEEL